MGRRIPPNPVHVFVDELSAEIAAENGLEVAEGNLLILIALKRNKDVIKQIAVPSSRIAIKRGRGKQATTVETNED